jgi:chromosome segregation ATPase
VDSATIIAGGSAAIALTTALLTYRSSAAANRAGQQKVGLEEHRDAMERLRQIIEEQDKHIDRIRVQLERVQDQFAHEQDVSAQLRSQLRSLQDQVDELMRSRARLEGLLAATGTNFRLSEEPRKREEKGT